MEIAAVAKLHAALSDPLRLRIAEELRAKGEACGKELASVLGVSVALVSHHAKVLEDAGLLVRRREGQYSRFSLNSRVLEEFRRSIPCAGNPTCPSA